VIVAIFDHRAGVSFLILESAFRKRIAFQNVEKAFSNEKGVTRNKRKISEFGGVCVITKFWHEVR